MNAVLTVVLDMGSQYKTEKNVGFNYYLIVEGPAFFLNIDSRVSSTIKVDMGQVDLVDGVVGEVRGALECCR